MFSWPFPCWCSRWPSSSWCSASTSSVTGFVMCWIRGSSAGSDVLDRGRRDGFASVPQRQPHRERRPRAVAGAFRPDMAVVQLHEIADECEAKTDAAVDARHRAVRLAETIEDVRQEGGRDADARIADRQLRLVVDASHPDAD